MDEGRGAAQPPVGHGGLDRCGADSAGSAEQLQAAGSAAAGRPVGSAGPDRLVRLGQRKPAVLMLTLIMIALWAVTVTAGLRALRHVTRPYPKKD